MPPVASAQRLTAVLAGVAAWMITSVFIANNAYATGGNSIFDAYPASTQATQRPQAPAAQLAQPQRNTAFARRFATRLREAAHMPANFNGRYRAATWGCGSGCQTLAIIDLHTGRVWHPPHAQGSISTCSEADARYTAAIASHAALVETTANSRLLRLNSCYDLLQPQPSAAHPGPLYYEWRGQQLVRAAAPSNAPPP